MTATTEKVRDLEADLAICETATPGPWVIEREDPHVVPGEYWSVYSLQNGRRLGIAESVSKANSQFTIEARTGWPYAIRRAMEAEREVDRLRNELNLLQKQLQSSGRRWD